MRSGLEVAICTTLKPKGPAIEKAGSRCGREALGASLVIARKNPGEKTDGDS